jgi:hypothetical protein
MRKHVALPIPLSNQTRGPVLFLFVQPLSASLQTAWRPVEFNPPEVNGIRLEVGVALPLKSRKMLNRLE